MRGQRKFGDPILKHAVSHSPMRAYLDRDRYQSALEYNAQAIQLVLHLTGRVRGDLRDSRRSLIN